MSAFFYRKAIAKLKTQFWSLNIFEHYKNICSINLSYKLFPIRLSSRSSIRTLPLTQDCWMLELCACQELFPTLNLSFAIWGGERALLSLTFGFLFHFHVFQTFEKFQCYKKGIIIRKKLTIVFSDLSVFSLVIKLIFKWKTVVAVFPWR